MDLWCTEGAFSTQFRQGNLHNQIVMCLCYVLFCVVVMIVRFIQISSPLSYGQRNRQEITLGLQSGQQNSDPQSAPGLFSVPHCHHVATATNFCLSRLRQPPGFTKQRRDEWLLPFRCQEAEADPCYSEASISWHPRYVCLRLTADLLTQGPARPPDNHLTCLRAVCTESRPHITQVALTH